MSGTTTLDKTWLQGLFPSRRRPLLGMIHLGPLPGSPRWGGDLAVVVQQAVSDANALLEGGVDGLMIENFGDAPFWPDRVPAVTIAALTAAATAVSREVAAPFGLNVLRNDGESALAIAAVVGAQMVRVNVLSGARVTDQGVLEGKAHRLLRQRHALGVEHVKILADVEVKHSSALGAPRGLSEQIQETFGRAGADAVIVSGAGTASPPDAERVREAAAAAGQAPVLVGSGLDVDNATTLLAPAAGAIVGSALQRGGVPGAPVEVERVRRLVAAVDSLSIA